MQHWRDNDEKILLYFFRFSFGVDFSLADLCQHLCCVLSSSSSSLSLSSSAPAVAQWFFITHSRCALYTATHENYPYIKPYSLICAQITNILKTLLFHIVELSVDFIVAFLFSDNLWLCKKKTLLKRSSLKCSI